jgi:hypothetical protein
MQTVLMNLVETRSTYFDALNGSDSKVSHIYVCNFLGTLFTYRWLSTYNLYVVFGRSDIMNPQWGGHVDPQKFWFVWCTVTTTLHKAQIKLQTDDSYYKITAT